VSWRSSRVRGWREVMRARGELSGSVALRAASPGMLLPTRNRVAEPSADTTLGLYDAGHLGGGVEMWLHPGELLVMVLCRHHSRQQAVALQEHRWSRLVRPRRVPVAIG
jgi:hypothetical protein